MRHLLLVVALVFAQLAAGVHALGHAAGDDSAVPVHACQLCLTAHDLGAALPSLLALPLAEFAAALPPAAHDHGRDAVQPPLASQRAPPVA